MDEPLGHDEHSRSMSQLLIVSFTKQQVSEPLNSAKRRRSAIHDNSTRDLHVPFWRSLQLFHGHATYLHLCRSFSQHLYVMILSLDVTDYIFDPLRIRSTIRA